MPKTLDAETKKLLIINFWWLHYRHPQPVKYKGEVVPAATVFEARQFLSSRIKSASQTLIDDARAWLRFDVTKEDYQKWSNAYDRIRSVK